MVSLELVTDFMGQTLNLKKDVLKEKVGILYIGDDSDRTTAMTEDIYSLCFITCIKPDELVKICPKIEVDEEEKKDAPIKVKEEEKKEEDENEE